VAMATEISNRNNKISCLLARYVLNTIYCKTYCYLPNANHEATKVDTKLMKIVLFCTKFKLNEAIGNTKTRVNTKLIKISTKMC
jgi:hypothetical protein